MSLDLGMVTKQKKFSICAFCETKVDYKTLYEESLKTIELLEFRIEQMHLKDSCYNKVYENEYQNGKLIMLETAQPAPFYTDGLVNMITLTFDPKKFPVLINRSAQRLYIRMIIDEYIELFNPGIIYGCFELHDSGVVHSHFIILNFSIDDLNWFKKQFTNNPKNDTAVHRCGKTLADGLQYVNKLETKDNNNIHNYFIYKKMSKNKISPLLYGSYTSSSYAQ